MGKRTRTSRITELSNVLNSIQLSIAEDKRALKMFIDIEHSDSDLRTVCGFNRLQYTQSITIKSEYHAILSNIISNGQFMKLQLIDVQNIITSMAEAYTTYCQYIDELDEDECKDEILHFYVYASEYIEFYDEFSPLIKKAIA